MPMRVMLVAVVGALIFVAILTWAIGNVGWALIECTCAGLLAGNAVALAKRGRI